jgi:lipopolysaccharide transport system permease protein
VDQVAEQAASEPHDLSRRSEQPTVRLEPTHGFSRMLSPSDLWRYRDLARQLAVRDITVRYRQTLLGAAWAILQPLAIMVVFTIFFGNLAHISSDGVPYALFSLVGLVPWTFFATCVQLGSDSLVMNSALVSKVYFPRIFLPTGIVAAALVDFAISFAILVVIVFVFNGHPSLGVLALPLLLAMAIATALGVSTALSALNVRYRDVRYVVPFLVQLWLFATPIAYPSSLLHEPWRTLSAINPMVGVVNGFRWAMLGQPPAPWAMIGISAASAVVVLAAGLAYFSRVERGFADIV